MKGSLGTESHGEEDSGDPRGWARMRLAFASFLLGSPIFFFRYALDLGEMET